VKRQDSSSVLTHLAHGTMMLNSSPQERSITTCLDILLFSGLTYNSVVKQIF